MSPANKIYSNTSQVLQRNEALFENKNILVAGNIDDDYPVQLQTLANSSTFCFSDYRYYTALKGKLNSSEVHFCANFQSNQKFDLLLIFLPKSKQESQYLLANLTPHLLPGAAIILVGEKKCGIKSAGSLLTPYSPTVNTIDSARHCSIIFAELTHQVKPFELQQWIKTYTLNINEVSIDICSLPGVFSYGELDKGSELLLQNLPNEMSGTVLDFGCGAGVLACYILSLHANLKIDLVDINIYAIESAKLSLAKNKLQANVFASNVFSDVSDKYDLLLSNPPFHSGQKTDYSAAETFIAEASLHLNNGGRMSIVANKFLRYEPLLNNVFSTVTTIAENNKFKVITSFNK
ncbi:16S rRNA (guanine(1207)-N(2))-methyltransferase RsmC [Psychromonas sp. MME1]|uniref:16S rRNA (guanine(1207)-N(2))-methyltransferase RsmC n=1 Tax=Psychromonas sp. MME1 TaxID=3231032 RepID=UPI0034E228E9